MDIVVLGEQKPPRCVRGARAMVSAEREFREWAFVFRKPVPHLPGPIAQSSPRFTLAQYKPLKITHGHHPCEYPITRE